MKKFMISTISVFVILLIVAVGVIYFYLGTIIKHGVEEYGPKITGTTVSLGLARVSILSGDGSLSNLKVGNPKGYEAKPHIFQLGSIRVKLDPKSVLEDTVVINEIKIIQPEIAYELTDKGDNIRALQGNINRNTASASKEKTEEGKPAGSGKKVLIENLYINDGKIDLALGGRIKDVVELTGEKTKEKIKLPDIHLKNLGKGKGITMAQAANIVMNEVARYVARTGVKGKFDAELRKLKGKVKKEIDKGVQKAKEKVQEKVKEEIQEGVDKGVDDIKGQIKDLF